MLDIKFLGIYVSFKPPDSLNILLAYRGGTVKTDFQIYIYSEFPRPYEKEFKIL